jgi:hypothetical protein
LLLPDKDSIHQFVSILADCFVFPPFATFIEISDQIFHLCELIGAFPRAPENGETFPLNKIIRFAIPHFLPNDPLYNELITIFPFEVWVVNFLLIVPLFMFPSLNFFFCVRCFRHAISVYIIHQMSKYFSIYILGAVCFYFGSTQKAILMSSSLGNYNYRQMSNIVKLYQNLRSYGFSDEDILLMIGEMQPCCEKNQLFASLSFFDGDYTNIFRGVEVGYSQSQLTAASVSNILISFYYQSVLNKRKQHLQKKMNPNLST